MRTYNSGILDALLGNTQREAKHSWPADCHIQSGDNGIVFTDGSLADTVLCPEKAFEAVAGAFGAPVSGGHYRTAFFEAFPKSPSTFIRGEGHTVEEAEDHAWRDFQRILSCSSHQYDRRHYRHGAGICRKCGLFSSSAFETTLDPCYVCGRTDNRASYGTDRLGRWHCEKCHPSIPENQKSELHLMTDKLRKDAPAR